MKHLCRRFDRDSAGAVAVVAVIGITILVGFAGAAVDTGRWFSARRQHAVAVDSAVLAGARHIQLNPGEVGAGLAVAERFYRLNLSPELALVSNTINFVTADGDSAVTFTGDAQIGTSFLNVLGITKLSLAEPSKASFKGGLSGNSNIEIAMMLDVTGSMCDDGVGPCTNDTKIAGLKAAASNLANIVLSNTTAGYTNRIALVPFAGGIRIAPDGSNNPMMQTLTGLPAKWSGWMKVCTASSGGGGGGETGGGGTCTASTATYMTDWKLQPCVSDRYFDSGIGFDPSDQSPSAGNWLNGHGGDRFPLSWDSSDLPIAMGEGTGTTAAEASPQWNYNPTGSCDVNNPGNEVLPLTTDLASVTNRIDTMTAANGTGGALGTAWAQYMLSPNWSGIWTGSSAPGAYSDTTTQQANGAPVLRKIAVLMTDGGYNVMRSWTSETQKVISDNAVAVCTNMKANGIEIYTVGFALDSLTSAERVIAEATLQACGTDLAHFYNSLTVDDLNAAFSDIAMKVTPLRLSQ